MPTMGWFCIAFLISLLGVVSSSYEKRIAKLERERDFYAEIAVDKFDSAIELRYPVNKPKYRPPQ